MCVFLELKFVKRLFLHLLFSRSPLTRLRSSSSIVCVRCLRRYFSMMRRPFCAIRMTCSVKISMYHVRCSCVTKYGIRLENGCTAVPTSKKPYNHLPCKNNKTCEFRDEMEHYAVEKDKFGVSDL